MKKKIKSYYRHRKKKDTGNNIILAIIGIGAGHIQTVINISKQSIKKTANIFIF